MFKSKIKLAVAASILSIFSTIAHAKTTSVTIGKEFIDVAPVSKYQYYAFYDDTRNRELYSVRYPDLSQIKMIVDKTKQDPVFNEIMIYRSLGGLDRHNAYIKEFLAQNHYLSDSVKKSLNGVIKKDNKLISNIKSDFEDYKRDLKTKQDALYEKIKKEKLREGRNSNLAHIYAIRAYSDSNSFDDNFEVKSESANLISNFLRSDFYKGQEGTIVTLNKDSFINELKVNFKESKVKELDKYKVKIDKRGKFEPKESSKRVTIVAIDKSDIHGTYYQLLIDLSSPERASRVTRTSLKPNSNFFRDLNDF